MKAMFLLAYLHSAHLVSVKNLIKSLKAYFENVNIEQYTHTELWANILGRWELSVLNLFGDAAKLLLFLIFRYDLIWYCSSRLLQ